MPPLATPASSVAPPARSALPPLRTVVKRDGRTLPYDRSRIAHAIEMAFRAEAGVPYPDPLDATICDVVESVTDAAETALSLFGTDEVSIEVIQDEVERALMAGAHYTVARRYIVYREARAQRRQGPRLRIRNVDGTTSVLEAAVLRSAMLDAARDLGPDVDADAVYRETIAAVYDGISRAELTKAAILATRSRIEQAPEYTYLAARLLLADVYAEAIGRPVTRQEMRRLYASEFGAYIERGIQASRLNAELRTFDITRLSAALDAARDESFAFMGVQTLYDRYLIHVGGRRIELPQWFWMRVAMGLALAERPEDRDTRAIEFYHVLSTFLFCSSTPTLFNAGTCHPQLSSCFLTTVQDDLGDIFNAIRDDAMLSKWSGGLGNDWTNVRALGSHIHGTNGESQGIIPFLKVANDTAVAVNQGGKRQGAMCAYLETWHLDIEEFLDLRKNTGDDRRRTHDMHLANWIPDTFMKRVRDGGLWTLFSPSDVPDLHDLSGAAFERAYVAYEAKADAGEIALFRRVDAVTLWRKMLAMLFETGHPWMTWKDPSNVRSPQDHVGVVHSSNLCTEILLNTSRDEVAVCNLGSVNLAVHVTPAGIDADKLARTVTTAVRMLDNVIDITLYPIPAARAANLRHRPVGLGLMGFQDALTTLGVSYASDAAVQFADESMERISYHAFLASSELARERGRYESYAGSKWDRGLLPIDTIDLLEQERGEPVPVDRSARLDWEPVRASIRAHGMRNSNVLAIAPTATIANICDVSQSIEPIYKNVFVKANLSGDFIVVNRQLVDDLRAAGVWDAQMIDDLKFHDGSVQDIPRIPESIKEKYLTAFEIEAEWLIECAARRQKWIDMGQSLNLYVDRPSGRRLDEMYKLAWTKGLKTTYYLRNVGAGGVEKSTLDVNARGIQPRWMKSASASSGVHVERETHDAVSPGTVAERSAPVCDLDGTCEACQ
jgi:ribonucleoside-diphosphate reductase alpha chain